jgi:hypothetical protein
MKPALAFCNIGLLLRLSTVAFLCCMASSLGAAPTLVSSSEINTSIQIEIAKSFPGFDANIVHGSEGYAAALLKKPIPNDDEHEIKVAVFRKATGARSYQLVSFSKSWKSYLLHRIGWGIHMKNQSILLYLGGSTSCCSGFDTEIHFKPTGESIQLVGEETWSHGGEDSKYYEARTSINYLTGKVIHYKVQGAGRDCEGNESAVKGRVTRQCFDGRPTSKEVVFSFSSLLNLDLSSFQPDNYFSYQKSVPELCGHLNKNMRYESCK